MNILIVDDQQEIAEKLKIDFSEYFKHYENINFEIKTDTFSQLVSETIDIAFTESGKIIRLRAVQL